MTLQTPPGRSDFRFDLSRWNRAGLTRFEYVDGDAAVWLEELRIAALGLYLRGIDPEDRVPEKWRDVFMKEIAQRQLNTDDAELESAIAWKNLLTAFPVDVETGGKRNQRLLEQYARQSHDYTWEIMRAFARAAHVLLGHQDAYANEGYLRTATQWDNLRKLAAMVNYQPTPPASATATIALELEPEKGVIEIARGLAMKFAPPEGGAPLIFETLKPVLAHEDLHGARTRDWNFNTKILNLKASTIWDAPEDADLAQGDPVVVTQFAKTGKATSLKRVVRNFDAGTAELQFETALPLSLKTGEIELLFEPDDVKIGLPRTTGKQLVIKTPGAASYSPGTVVEVVQTAGKKTIKAVVESNTNGLLTLLAPETLSGSVTIEAFTPFAAGALGDVETPLNITKLYYKRVSGAGRPVLSALNIDTRDDHADIANIHEQPAAATGLGFARVSGSKVDSGNVVKGLGGSKGTAKKAVRFEGSPPKSLSQGDWYVARPIGSSNLTALKVSSIRVEAEVYFVTFNADPPAAHHKTEFFGPMTRTLRPVEYDQDQDDAIIGGEILLEGLSPEAQNLVKAGRDIVIVFEKGDDRRAAQATITSVEPKGPSGKFLEVTLPDEQNFSGWQAGWTKFHLNTVDVSHGETKDPKILGSGDAEKRRQDFVFKITDVSFVPSNAAVTGVAPDMDVTVDGVKWEFRDIGDPTAEGEDAWSAALNEDDTLQVHFRRRLPTGTNNVAIARHRVGVGAKGTGVPAFSFTKPMKKNRFVAGIVQPIATAGGSNREPVGDIRENAPANLAANGRAVSLRDFGRLSNRHSSVWQAHAREVIKPGAINRVEIIIVPANGGPVTPTLEQDLIEFVEGRTLPNVQVTITGYQSIDLRIHVKIYVDTDRYEKRDVKDATEAALAAEFALSNRALGQPVYVAEILAAVERVEGVSSATIVQFARKPGAPAPLREALVSGSLAATFPKEEQVAVLRGIADVTVTVEAAS